MARKGRSLKIALLAIALCLVGGASSSIFAEVAKGSAYGAMIARSLISTGNNVRMKAAIAKAKAGKSVTIAYIGGSITEGYNATEPYRNYVELSASSFKSLFGQGVALNAGMSGTPSSVGIVRYQRDVLDKLDTPPDIVVIEFAVNDGDDPTNGAAFESLALKILKADNAPAVVLLFSVFKSQWNLQDRLEPIGKYYDLPMISIKDAVVPEINSGKMKEDDFFSDIYHPTDYGHQIMADCLTRYFKAVDAEAADKTDIAIPAKGLIGNQFAGLKMVDSANVPENVDIELGGFDVTDYGIVSFGYDHMTFTFPDNWYKDESNPNDAFTMKISCKNLILVYKDSSSTDFGTAQVFVDGKLARTLNGHTSAGWNNPFTSVIIDQPTKAMHTVSIKMAKGSEGSCFSILAFGYTE